MQCMADAANVPLPHPIVTYPYFLHSLRLRAVLSKSLIQIRADFAEIIDALLLVYQRV